MQIEERFNLKEGPVHITMPAELSLESFQDLADRVALFLRIRERCLPELREDTVKPEAVAVGALEGESSGPSLAKAE